ncbi:MAG: glycosyltransferase [Paracoccus sp. (in: a-proteobacteria)]
MILTMPHTLYIAQRLQATLAEVGIKSVLSDNDRIAKNFNIIFAIALQNFPAVPENNCIAFQVEQSVFPYRWPPEYLQRLAKCRAVLEYSQQNIKPLQKHVAKEKIIYVPLSPGPIMKSGIPRRQPILFYGDISFTRRNEILAKIRASIPELEIETNLFGPDMANRLHNTKIVLNIHAWKGGLLETARISEALAHGCIVVSETSVDQAQYRDFQDRILYVPEGDSKALVTTLRKLLDDPAELHHRQKSLNKPHPDHFRMHILHVIKQLRMITSQTEVIRGI